jgi:hypothetical protein
MVAGINPFALVLHMQEKGALALKIKKHSGASGI